MLANLIVRPRKNSEMQREYMQRRDYDWSFKQGKKENEKWRE